MKKIFIAVLAFCVSGMAASAQDGLRTTELNVFKNGTYFVVKEGEVPVSGSVGKIKLPPAPLMGTFWLTTVRDVSIEKVVYMTDTIKSTRPARTIPDLLSSNKGKKIRVNYRLDEKNYADLSGTLQDFYTTTGIVKIKTSEGKYAYLPAGDIRQLFVEENPSESVKFDSTAYLGRIEFGRSPSSAKLKLVYMQAGIQWIPSYNIKIINDKELQLEMRALVENFAEIVDNADLTLTVGNPNYKYGRATEPFINPYLTNLGGAQPAAYNQYMFQNRMDKSAMPAMAAESSAGGIAYDDYQVFDTEGEKSNDLFMYKLGKVTIPRNSKATFQVFSQKFPYKDNFKVTIPDVVNYGGTRYITNDPDRKFDVYHSLKITNSTKNPLTTAPVFVMDEELRPLAQDEIRYTAAGDNVSVQLSKSPDIIVKNEEEETGREERARVIDKNTYNKITIKGEIRIQNLLEKKITLNVVKTVNALITDVTDNGNIRKPPRFSGLNPNSTAEWDLNLEANGKITLRYTYEVYVNAKY